MNKQGKPELKNGYTKIANELLEVLMNTYLSNYERRVIDCIIRYTYGFHKKETTLSLSFIARATGISLPNVSHTKKKLLNKNMVVQIDNKLRLQKYYKEWVVQIDNHKRLSKQTTKVVQMNNKSCLNRQCLNKQIINKTIIKKTYKENIMSKDITKSYGNPDINKIISYLKEKLQLPSLDGSVRNNRRYANLLLKKSKTGLAGVLWLIDVTSGDDWYKNNTTSTKDLYYNAVKILARRRKEVNKYVDYSDVR